ncbi:MAG: flagellar hook-basal body protein [Campylobacterales bacterium]
MQAGFYAAAGGMVAQFNRLDVISNNLANLNTNGYKRDDLVFGDYLRLSKESEDELPLANQTKAAAKFLNRTIDRVPHVVEEYTNWSLGGMMKTNNPLDLALAKEDRFFMVLTPAGVRFTRDGAFVLSEDGTLTTREGFPVLPNDYFRNRRTIQLDRSSVINIDKNGNIQAKNAEGVMVPVATLFVAKFREQRQLEKIGQNLYRSPEAEPVSSNGEGVILQGYLEKSNVNPVSEMIGLIETNRMVSMYQKVMDAHMNDLNNDAINKLATTRA